jgi:hypothetical protein
MLLPTIAKFSVFTECIILTYNNNNAAWCDCMLDAASPATDIDINTKIKIVNSTDWKFVPQLQNNISVQISYPVANAYNKYCNHYQYKYMATLHKPPIA